MFGFLAARLGESRAWGLGFDDVDDVGTDMDMEMADVIRSAVLRRNVHGKNPQKLVLRTPLPSLPLPLPLPHQSNPSPTPHRPPQSTTRASPPSSPPPPPSPAHATSTLHKASTPSRRTGRVDVWTSSWRWAISCRNPWSGGRACRLRRRRGIFLGLCC